MSHKVIRNLLNEVLTHLLDAANWNAYVSACGQLPTDPASYLATFLPSASFYRTYDSWANFNCLVNGFTDPNGKPTPLKKTDRHLFGNYQPALLRGFFGEVLSERDCNELKFYFGAGQQYMNLCDDVHALTTQVSSSAVIDWSRLTAKMEQIADADIDAWFGPSVVLALAQSAGASSAVVQQGTLDPSTGSGTVVVSIV